MKIETIIIGGGQAGLATSYYLTQLGREHLVLEQAAQAANAWRNDRWDSFTLVSPNWSFCLPGAEYQGPAPEAYMPRSEVIAAFEQYVQRYHLLVQYQTRVTAVEPSSAGAGYQITTAETTYQARNVVVAMGLFQRPKIPFFASDLAEQIVQIHTGQYRNPQSLPDGAVLVVGSAQSGCQIAEELYQSGRKVYMSIGNAGRLPRRYRGRDVFDWLNQTGFLDRSVDMLTSPKAKYGGNPHLSGRAGGRTLNLHQFARDGVVLLGHLQGADENRIWLAADLKDCLVRSDKFETEIVRSIDHYIQQNDLEAPTESLPELRDGYAAPVIPSLDLRAAGVTSVIWAIGYAFDFHLVRLPIFDNDGYPLQRRGVTDFPGLYFVGLPWLTKQKSGLLIGVGEDAQFIASEIAARS